jgi:hypothetical protein
MPDETLESEIIPMLSAEHALSADGKRIEVHAAAIRVGNLRVRFTLVGFKDGVFVGDRVDLTQNIMALEDACMALKARVFSNAQTTLRKLHDKPTG